MKILTFPTEMKPSKCPAKDKKKNGTRKAKEAGRRESENLEILISTYARSRYVLK